MMTATHDIRRTLAAALVALTTLSPTVVGAQDDALADLSLEQLMSVKVEPVFGASKRLQPVTEAPASITIVTAEQIRQFGYRTLADLLRSVPGLYVSSDHHYEYLGVRGFSRPGDYGGRVLIVVNGHRMNDAIYDQASIGLDMGLDPSLYDRVEVIRGPGSALYGTNAFFAVVNIVTKPAARLRGTQVDVTGGSEGTMTIRSTSAGRLSPRLGEGLFSATLTRSGGEALFAIPEMAVGGSDGIAHNADSEAAGQMFGQIGTPRLHLTGLLSRRAKHIPTASFGALFNDNRFRAVDQRAYVEAEWDQSVGRTRLDVRSYVDSYDYLSVVPYPSEDADPVPYLQHDDGLGTWGGAEARVSRPIGTAHTVTAGAEFRDNWQQRQRVTSGGRSGDEFDIRVRTASGAAYVQDEFRPLRALLLNGGLRLDHRAGQTRMTPRVAAVLRLSGNDSLKFLHGRAFRSPNAYESHYYPANHRSPGLGDESIATTEAVWERYTGRWLRTSVSGYTSEIDDLIQLAAFPGGIGGLDDLIYLNMGHVDARGLELEGEIKARTGLAAAASVSLQSVRDSGTDTSLSNSPRAIGTLRLSARPAGRLTTALEAQFIGRRTTPSDTVVPAATVVHLTVTTPQEQSVGFVVAARNLFDNRYLDPASTEHRSAAIAQHGRTITASLVWRTGRTR